MDPKKSIYILNKIQTQKKDIKQVATNLYQMQTK